MAIKNKAFRNFTALVGVQLINYLLPLIVLPVIVRIIGPANFGIINYANTIVNYLVLFIGFSFELSAVRLVTIHNDDKSAVNKIYNKVLFARIILFIISSLVFCLSLYYLKSLHKERLVAIFTFLMCIAVIFDPSWFFTAKQDIHRSALFTFITKTLLNVSLLCFIRKQNDYIYQPLIISLSQIVVMGYAFLWTIRHYNLKISFPGLRPIWNIIWQDKVLFFHSFSHTIYTTLNIVILGMLKGSLAVGYYAAAWKLIIIIQALLISPLGIVLFPIIGYKFKENKEDGILLIQKSVPLILIATILVGIGIFLFSNIAITLLYGSNFNVSIELLKLLSFIPMLAALNMLLGIQAMVNLKMDKLFFSITIAAAGLSILFNFVLIQHFNAAGAAISWVLTELFCTITMYVVLKRNTVNMFNHNFFQVNSMKSLILPTVVKLKNQVKKVMS